MDTEKTKRSAVVFPPRIPTRPLPIQSFTERHDDLPYLIVGLVALVATVLGIWIILEVL